MGWSGRDLIFVDIGNSIAFHVPKRLLKKFVNELLLKSSINLLTDDAFYKCNIGKLHVSEFDHLTLIERQAEDSH